ncbi:MAG: hypothetical protein HON14_13255 [Rhodospirillaceae bacterium]|jgi:hypothetical protein|nr:hypothetical protein [Rhodospirillaceae bacterium]MBT4588121.1 hypothetical protein [Rhodospirillaceae bacterium]MBT4940095.1 hypothetical protein [Rhodospirillaceae bacterium]MBT5939340.1 hypothetical protein [Rhodospirillaceae bacterium]MBT7268464.1 hypothetical protein [Rhodospirillaceae bacterium]
MDHFSEVRDNMKIDWDYPIAMDDGLVLRADIFGGTVSLHAGPDQQSFLLLPVIP